MDLVVLIDSADFVVASTSRLLKQRDAAAVGEADEIVKRARVRESRLHEQTLIAFEQSRQRGWRKGMALAQADMAQRLARAEVARQVALRDLAPVLVEIVADAVELLVKAAPRQALVASAIESVGGLLRQARWAHLRLHPSQVDAARAAVADARGRFGGVDIVSVVGDASVGVDDCIFDTSAGIADASLSVQLDAIRRAVDDAVTALAEAGSGAAGGAAAGAPAAERAAAQPDDGRSNPEGPAAGGPNAARSSAGQPAAANPAELNPTEPNAVAPHAFLAGPQAAEPAPGPSPAPSPASATRPAPAAEPAGAWGVAA